MKAVTDFPTPKNQTQLKSFLGLASSNGNYVQGFASIALPLEKASETSSAFQWTHKAQLAFDSSKTSLTTTPVLAFAALQKPFILYRDATQFAMGVLSQEHDCCERFICCSSGALSKSQIR